MKRLASLLSIFCLCSLLLHSQSWIDLTEAYITNPHFDTNSTQGWIYTSDASNQAGGYGGWEFWNGSFNIYKTITVPNGKYRISAQAYYRTTDNKEAYENYCNGTEDITAFLYANDSRCPVASIYSEHLDEDYAQNCWKTRDENGVAIYFPNGMQSGSHCFTQGMYMNSVETEVTNGTLTLGIVNDNHVNSNWCMMDNFKLEYYSALASPTAESLIINEIQVANIDMFVDPSFNYGGWVELYNPTDKAVSLNGLYISDDADMLTKHHLNCQGILPAKGYRVIWFDHHHYTYSPTQVDFKLDFDGGSIYISDHDGEIITSQEYPVATPRTSYARVADGTNEWRGTAEPTPGTSNATSTFCDERLEAPVVDVDAQLFSHAFAVKVTVPSGCTLRYTTDGTTPTLTNGMTSSTGKFFVNKTTTYRFRLFQEGKLPSQVVTRTYIHQNRDYALPIISIVTDPVNLYDDYLGVAVRGVNGRTGNGQSSPCNWNMDWDRPVNFEYITPEGGMVINQEVDLAMCGGWSRAFTPHSFKLKASKIYEGNNSLDYPFFSDKPYLKHKTLQIRNGGNDVGCRIKDAALQEIVHRSGLDVDGQSTQPVLHFINGVYKGMLNMREPNNKHFAYANWGIDTDEMDQFEMSPDSGYVQMEGDREAFLQWYALSADAADAATYEEICHLVDIDEYINYMAVEFYLGGIDWPQNNVKGFRPRTPDGRFRFVLFDLDHVLEYEDSPFELFESRQTYTFDYIYDLGGRLTEEIELVTIFLNMLNNESFRKQFVDTYCLVAGSVFEPERCQAIIDEMSARIAPSLAIEGHAPYGTANKMKDALTNRPTRMIEMLINYHRTQLTADMRQEVTVAANIDGASLRLNNLEIPTGKFSGTLFAPITLKAEPKAGYRFVGWADSEGIVSESSSYTLPVGDLELTAVYEPLHEDELVGEKRHVVRVNEVSADNSIYVNEYYKKNDWVELFNCTSAPIDVAGMYLSDDLDVPTKYQIVRNADVNTVIEPYGHLILWADKLMSVSQLHAPFKLASEGGYVTLTAADRSWRDVLYYTPHLGTESVGLYPDGTSNVYLMTTPSIAAGNTLNSYATYIEQPETPWNGQSIASPHGERIALTFDSPMLHIYSDASSARITAHSATGQQYLTTDIVLKDRHAVLNLGTLPRGVYIINVTDSYHHTKVIKIKL